MSSGWEACCPAVRRRSGGLGPILAILGLTASVYEARAGGSIDCASLEIGRLDVAAVSDRAVRTVEMNAGDTLAFAFRSDTRAKGTVTIGVGDGPEQRLSFGPHATQVFYTAETSGTVRFRLDIRGGRVATFVTTCTPALASDVMALDGLTVEMPAPLLLGINGAAEAQDAPAHRVAPGGAALQWLGGLQEQEPLNGTLGINLKLQPSLKVGILAQFDQAGDPLLGPTALSDQHWVAGPAMSVLLGAGLSLDAHAAWTLPDPVSSQAATQKSLDVRLVGKQEVGNWRFTPTVSFAHTQAKYGSGAESPGQQTVESGRVDVRPEMAYRIDLGNSLYMEPKIMVGTYWSLGDTGGTLSGRHEPRPMAETGITFGTSDGTRLEVGGGVQEGETRAESVWTGKVQLNIPLK